MTIALLSVRIHHEHDIVAARQRARQIAGALGFDATEQTRIATAVSEIARNAYAYAGGGRVEYSVDGETPPQLLIVTVSDKGNGIANLDDVLAGRYRSRTGMGLGIVGTRRLMDHFAVQSGPSGTTVTLKKILPRRTPLAAAKLTELADRLAAERPKGPVEEVQQQNQELLQTLDALQARQEELERVNRELEDTNRGVVALYAELDERADHLRRADELKTRFLSNMTHEFRTPVNSILALTSLLAERLQPAADEKDEIYYIRKSAQQLSDIVNDLLDLAKVEAGKIEVRPAPFEVHALFGALRGMLRPLLMNHSSLSLVFDEPEGLPPIFSDESKVSQILRNFISNALKYTEAGEVRVTAQLTPERDAVHFSVADTGIGIPEEQLGRVFDEFVQIENPLQRRSKGTGLGLPLSKRLAELLGGRIELASVLGQGSTFSVVVPLIYRDVTRPVSIAVRPGLLPVLVIEDSDEDLLLYERALHGTRYQTVPARSVTAAMHALDQMRPAVIILDIRLHGQDSWDVLARLKRDTATAAIPLIVASTVDEQQKGFALGADAYAVKPVAQRWLLRTLDQLTPRDNAVRVLTIDDEDASRFIIRGLLNDARHQVHEAVDGAEGISCARGLSPDVILLDVRLGDMSGLEVRRRLREDPATAQVPVIMVTAQRLSSTQRADLAGTPVLSKSALTRESLQSAIRNALAARGSQAAADR
jgi:signal transduction histidine kinase/DNA-binding response OmpR family regulator